MSAWPALYIESLSQKQARDRPATKARPGGADPRAVGRPGPLNPLRVPSWLGARALCLLPCDRLCFRRAARFGLFFAVFSPRPEPHAAPQTTHQALVEEAVDDVLVETRRD